MLFDAALPVHFSYQQVILPCNIYLRAPGPLGLFGFLDTTHSPLLYHGFQVQWWKLQKHLNTWDSIVLANNYSSRCCYQRKNMWVKERRALSLALAAGSIHLLLTFLTFVLSACSLLFWNLAWQQECGVSFSSPHSVLPSSEQEQVKPSIWFRPQPRQSVQGQTLWNKHALILPKRISGLQSDTPLVVSQRKATWFQSFYIAETYFLLCDQ